MPAQVKPQSASVIPIGDLRDRVTIQRETTTPDTLGGFSVSWSNLYINIPANVRSVKGREAEIEGREMTIRTYLVTIRHGYSVTTKDRVIWGDETMAITSVENRDGQARRLTLECEVGFGS